MPDLRPTLGPLVVDWIEAYTRHGLGDIVGQRVVLDDDMLAFIYRAYEVWPKGHRLEGRRVYSRAFRSRRKGMWKTGLSACIAQAEFSGPVRFAGWDAEGNPVGRPVSNPDIPVAATSEEQAEDTIYGAIYQSASHSPDLSAEWDILQSKIQFADDRAGSMRPVTSSSVARDGGNPSFTPCDETHLWFTPPLKRFHATLRRNMRKRPAAEPWMLETSTMYQPGQGSVAEDTHAYAKSLEGRDDATLLFDHLQANPTAHDMTTDEGVRGAIREASGLALPWTDVEGILEEWWDPAVSAAEWWRYWGNRPMQSDDQFFDVEAWKARRHPRMVGHPDRIRDGWPPDGSAVVLGFDGARFDDNTAWYGWTVGDPDDPDGYHGFHAGLWGPPDDGSDEFWQVPGHEVDDRLEELMDRFRVLKAYCDPPYWYDDVERWQSKFSSKIIEAWETRRTLQMSAALTRFKTAMLDRECRMTNDGMPSTAQHLGNAYRWERHGGVVIGKAHPKALDKIDEAMAATVGHEARADAFAAGLHRKRRSRAAGF